MDARKNFWLFLSFVIVIGSMIFVWGAKRDKKWFNESELYSISEDVTSEELEKNRYLNTSELLDEIPSKCVSFLESVENNRIAI